MQISNFASLFVKYSNLIILTLMITISAFNVYILSTTFTEDMTMMTQFTQNETTLEQCVFLQKINSQHLSTLWLWSLRNSSEIAKKAQNLLSIKKKLI